MSDISYSVYISGNTNDTNLVINSSSGTVNDNSPVPTVVATSLAAAQLSSETATSASAAATSASDAATAASGVASTASEAATTASGAASTASGAATTASGAASTASGAATTASGAATTAATNAAASSTAASTVLASVQSVLADINTQLALQNYGTNQSVPALMKLVATDVSARNVYLNNPWVNFSNLNFSDVYIGYGAPFYKLGLYCWLSGQMLSNNGPACPISANTELIVLLAHDGKLDYAITPQIMDMVVQGGTGYPASPYAGDPLKFFWGNRQISPYAEGVGTAGMGISWTAMNPNFNYFNVNFQKWLVRMNALLEIEKVIGLAPRGVNNSSTVTVSGDEYTVTIGLNKVFLDLMDPFPATATGNSIIPSAHALAKNIAANKGTNVDINYTQLMNAWTDVCSNILPAIQSDSGFGIQIDNSDGTLFHVIPFMELFPGLAYSVHSAIVEMISRVNGAVNGTVNDPSYNLVIDANGDISGWSDISFDYHSVPALKAICTAGWLPQYYVHPTPMMYEAGKWILETDTNWGTCYMHGFSLGYATQSLGSSQELNGVTPTPLVDATREGYTFTFDASLPTNSVLVERFSTLWSGGDSTLGPPIGNLINFP